LRVEILLISWSYLEASGKTHGRGSEKNDIIEPFLLLLPLKVIIKMSCPPF